MPSSIAHYHPDSEVNDLGHMFADRHHPDKIHWALMPRTENGHPIQYTEPGKARQSPGRPIIKQHPDLYPVAFFESPRPSPTIAQRTCSLPVKPKHPQRRTLVSYNTGEVGGQPYHHEKPLPPPSFGAGSIGGRTSSYDKPLPPAPTWHPSRARHVVQLDLPRCARQTSMEAKYGEVDDGWVEVEEVEEDWSKPKVSQRHKQRSCCGRLMDLVRSLLGGRSR
jgi:hypothetical protein